MRPIDMLEAEMRDRLAARDATIASLTAERDRLMEALTLVERIYYMEEKTAEWRASKMNSVARDAANPEADFKWAQRLFPRAALKETADD